MELTHELDERGFLKSLKWGDHEFIRHEHGNGSLWGARLRRPNGETYAAPISTIKLAMNWTVSGSVARCDITFENPTPDTLESVFLDVMHFQAGAGDPEIGKHSHFACGFDQPNGSVMRMPGTQNYLAIFETRQNPNACFGLASYNTTAERNSWFVRIGLRDEGQMQLGLDVSSNELPAGRSISFAVHFAVCASRTEAAAFAREWAKSHPMVARGLDFDLGMTFLCSRVDMGTGEGPNPNAYGNKYFDKIEVGTSTGIEILRAQIHEIADACVFYAKRAELGGVITWDVEGIGFDKYVGNPMLTFAMAPEMRSILADYFAILNSAGLRVGVCIRPGFLVPVGNRWERRRNDTPDAYETAMLRMNMEWARDAWGCDLFYLDSNNARYSAVQLRDLQMACPWAVILSENAIEATYGSSLLYVDSRQWPNGFQVPWMAREMYPEAQAVVCVYDTTPNEHIAAIWEQGSRIITNVWHASNVLQRIGRMKAQRGRKEP